MQLKLKIDFLYFYILSYDFLRKVKDMVI